MTIPESTSIVLNLTCQQYKRAVTKAHLVIQLACLEFIVRFQCDIETINYSVIDRRKSHTSVEHYVVLSDI